MMSARAMGGSWPKLENKLSGGWQEFERGWTNKMNLIKGMAGGPPADELLFELIKNSLDESDTIFMQNFRESSPQEKFQNFFQELKQKYCIDPTKENRKTWENLTLQQTAGRLNLANWSLFKEKFCLFSKRVENRTEEEEHDLLIEKLPLYWQRKVMEEERRQRRYRCLVRITGPPPQAGHILKELLEQKTNSKHPKWKCA